MTTVPQTPCHGGSRWRQRAPLLAACVLLAAGCRGAAPGNIIELQNDTASPAHVEYAYDSGLLGTQIGAPMSQFDVPAQQTLPVGATYKSTTLTITVGGRTLQQPVTPAGPCNAVLVVLLASGGTQVETVPWPGACPSP